jgi:hypothetical protein
MPIPLPNLDDRRYTDLVDEGRSLIPVYSPEWTNFNASDPGITLMELFAFVAEMDIYQINRVPDRHKRKFLELIGVKPEPPHPAQVALAVTVSGTSPVSVPARTAFSVSNLPFRTLADLTAAPASLNAIQTTDGTTFRDATATFPDEPLWPFGIPPQTDSAIYFGFDQPLAPNVVTGFVFHFAGTPVSPLAGRHHSAVIVWEYLNAFGWWSPLQVDDSTRSFSTDGHLRITGPSQMRQSAIGRVTAPLFYIRAHYTAGQYDTPPKLLSAAWNAVEAEQAESAVQTWPIAPGTVATGADPTPGQMVSVLFGFDTIDRINSLAFDSTADPKFRVLSYYAAGPSTAGAITFELFLVAAGTGAPFQHTPLAGGPAVVEASVQLYTLESGSWHTWESRLSFDSSSPADSHFILEAQTGDVQFGDGLHARALPEGALLFASYSKTAAALGTVAGGITAAISLPSIAGAVTAPPATPGLDAETLEGAIGRAANQREAPLRAVTLAEYETLALSTPGTTIARVSARANLYAGLDCFEALGVVTVIVVPDMPIPMPPPSDGLLAAVRAYLNPRRVIGTRIEVVPPGYLQVSVNATVQSGKGQNQARLQQAIIAALNAFLDPLIGGPDGTGWPFGRDVYETEILQILAQTPGVDHVNSLVLAPTGCTPQCGNICVKPTWLVTPGQHQIEVL